MYIFTLWWLICAFSLQDESFQMDDNQNHELDNINHLKGGCGKTDQLG